MKPCERKITESLRIGSLNIGTGLYAKEELLINTIQEQKCNIIGISEVDIEYFDEKKCKFRGVFRFKAIVGVYLKL